MNDPETNAHQREIKRSYEERLDKALREGNHGKAWFLARRLSALFGVDLDFNDVMPKGMNE